MTFSKALHSSKSNEWQTPQALYAALDREFGFTLDPCSTAENAKCAKFYTQTDDGLAQNWAGETVFMNPPYGREIGKWVRKAYEESRRGATVVCLIPARTDTRWFHDSAIHGEIRFLKTRPSFYSPDQVKPNKAPFPCLVVIFRPVIAIVANEVAA